MPIQRFASLLVLLTCLCSGLVGQPPQGDGIDQQRAQLERSGPEEAEARQRAIDALVQMVDPRAHAVLQTRLAATQDPDDVRLAILLALQRELRRADSRPFAAGDDHKEPRAQLVRGWAGALLPFWRGRPDADDHLPQEPLREAARGCLTRLPVRELELALRDLLQNGSAADQDAAMVAAADTQNLLFAPLLAEQIDAESPARRSLAQTCLRRLCFVMGGFASRAEFTAWWDKNGKRRYVDVAEEAARGATGSVARHREELIARLQRATVDLVSVHVRRPAQVDWAKVQALVLTDDPPGTTDACLTALTQLLQDAPQAENQDGHRQAFHRALRQQLKDTAADHTARRALLLEVAALLLRPGEPDLASEMEQLLLENLSAVDEAVALAAIRGVRRFPSPTAREAVVAAALAVAGKEGDGERLRLREALRTLGRRGELRWRAPAPNEAGKDLWVQLLRTVLQRKDLVDLREEAFALASQTDSRDERLGEAFELLLALATDGSQPFENRTACLIHLRDFCSSEPAADALVRALATLLTDTDPRLRRFAATALAQPPDLGEGKKRDWLRVTHESVRGRLLIEPDPAVFGALCDSLMVCAAPPGSPDTIIGSLRIADEDLKKPIAAEHQFRLEPLLKVVVAIGSLPTAKPGTWLSACRILLNRDKRRSLRLVLDSQHAVRLAKDVRDQDEVSAEAARGAMGAILGTALLKPPKESWSDNRDEANEVRSAFAALDAAQVDVDTPELRLLRLAVLTSLGPTQPGIYKEVLGLCDRYLGDAAPRGHAALDAAQKNMVRLYQAEAQIGLLDPAAAATTLQACEPASLTTPTGLQLQERLGRAFADLDKPDPVQALLWADRALRETPEADPRYRARLLLSARVRVLADPARRTEVLELLERNAPLFAAAECPQELKDGYAKLKSQLQ